MARQVNPVQVALFYQLNAAFRTMKLYTPAQWQAVIKEHVGLNSDGSHKMLTRLTVDEMRTVLTKLGLEPEATAS